MSAADTIPIVPSASATSKVAYSNLMIENDRIDEILKNKNKERRDNVNPSKDNSITREYKALNLTPYDNLMIFLPGATNAIYSPYLFIQGLKALKDNVKSLDFETSLVAKFRILQAPASFINAIGYTLIEISQFLALIGSKITLSKLYSLPFVKVTAILGLLVTAVETAIETIGLIRSVKFSSDPIFSIQGFIKELKDSNLIGNELFSKVRNYLNTNKAYLKSNLGEEVYAYLTSSIQSSPYLNEILTTSTYNDCYQKLEADLLFLALANFMERTISPKAETVEKIKRANPEISDEQANEKSLQLNLEELSRKIHLFAANEVQKNLLGTKDNLLKDLTSSGSKAKQAIADANKLIDLLKSQNSKKIFVHIIGLISIALTFLSLILVIICIFNPALIPIVLAIVIPDLLYWSGFGISIVHYCLNTGFMGCKGWHFSFEKTIPDWVKTTFENIKRWRARKPTPLLKKKISHNSRPSTSAS